VRGTAEGRLSARARPPERGGEYMREHRKLKTKHPSWPFTQYAQNEAYRQITS